MTFITKKPCTDKAIKTLRIYSILLDKKEVSRSDLTVITGVNAVSISQYVSSFLKDGLVIEKEVGESSGGRPPVILELAQTIFCMGIHILSNKIKVMLITPSLRKIYEENFSYDQFSDVEEIINKLNKDILDKYPLSSVTIASDKETDQELKSFIGFFQKNDIPVYISSASEAGAYISSFQLLPKDDNKKILFVYEDLGDCVLFHENNLYTAEEQKYLYFKPWKKSLGILENAQKVFDKEPSKISYKQIYDACTKGDMSCSDIVHFVALNLGVRIAYLINLFEADVVFLGGELSTLKEYFIDPFNKFVFKMIKKSHKDNFSIEYIENEKYPIVYGLAGLAVRQLFIGG